MSKLLAHQLLPWCFQLIDIAIDMQWVLKVIKLDLSDVSYSEAVHRNSLARMSKSAINRIVRIEYVGIQDPIEKEK